MYRPQEISSLGPEKYIIDQEILTDDTPAILMFPSTLRVFDLGMWVFVRGENAKVTDIEVS